MQRTRTRKLIFGALLTALAVVLKSFLGIPVTMFGGFIKDINFSAGIVMYAGIALGPVYGGIVGRAHGYPVQHHPPDGRVYAAVHAHKRAHGHPACAVLFKKQRYNFWRTLLSVTTAQLVCSFCFNTLILIMLGMPWGVAWFRSISAFVLIPVHTAVIFALLKATEKFLARGLALAPPNCETTAH